MNKMKPLRFYQIVIVVSCIVFSWGFAKFALFTQHEFREWINFGDRYDYEADWGQKGPGISGDGGRILEKEKHPKYGQRINSEKNKVNDLDGTALQNKKSIFATIIITILILLLIFRYIQKRKRKTKIEVKEVLNLTKQVEKEKPIYEEDKGEPVLIFNEIRQELIKWEKQLYQDKKRKPYETVQQWFQRIGKSPHIIPIYEKVRYGEKEYSVNELKMVRHWVKE